MKFNNLRKIGKLGPEVTPVGLGAMSFTNFYGPCNDEQAHNVLKLALDLGINHIDTSNVYGMGESEKRIGYFSTLTSTSLGCFHDHSTVCY